MNDTITELTRRWKSFPIITRIAVITIYVIFIFNLVAAKWLWGEHRMATWVVSGVAFVIVGVSAYRKYMND